MQRGSALDAGLISLVAEQGVGGDDDHLLRAVEERGGVRRQTAVN
jgi:hypothetical protein